MSWEPVATGSFVVSAPSFSDREVREMVVPTATSPRPHVHIARLAEIWPPYDPAGSVIVGAVPIDSIEARRVEQEGFTVLKETLDHHPYTHVISTGTHDYLARLEAME
jgi:hypothetical protein